jgi:SAM-dependent methyltransferase
MAVERVDGDVAAPPWKEEHAARYHWAARYAVGKNVLDIACGTGFGAAILLDAGAASVVAGDLSNEALAASTRRLSGYGERAQVHLEDCMNLTFTDGAFDVVVSMETIEHIPAPERFLKEVSRVLRPGGLLLLSTPNGLVTNPTGGRPENPFHVREFTPHALQDLVGPWFHVEEALGQHLPSAYGVAPFLPSFRKEDLSVRQRVGFWYWRMILRLPLFREWIHRRITGFSFYPGAKDYTFRKEDLKRAHVQVLVCRQLVAD